PWRSGCWGWRRRHEGPAMTTRTLSRRVVRLERVAGRHANPRAGILHQLRADPAELMALAGMAPDPWQTRLMRPDLPRPLLLCARQGGKSSVAAALALRTALLQPGSLVLLLSPSLRQSGELFRKVLDLFNALGRPLAVAAESALRLELNNGARVVCLPGDEK